MREFSHRIVTSTMDIDKQAAMLNKKIEKLSWEIKNKVLTDKQIEDMQEKIKAIKEQIEALGGQLTPLVVTKIIQKTHN